MSIYGWCWMYDKYDDEEELHGFFINQFSGDEITVT